MLAGFWHGIAGAIRTTIIGVRQRRREGSGFSREMETAWDALAAEDEGNLYLDSDLAEKIYVAYHVLDADPIKGAQELPWPT